MKILIATDAWHPQVNGVVRTLTSLARSASALGRRHRLSHARRLSVDGVADLSGPAHRAAEPARDRAADRGGRAGRHPYRDRRPGRLGGARLLPPPQARVHHVLHHALSGICRGPHQASRPASAMPCCGTFMPLRPWPWSRRTRCGRNSARAGFRQARLLDARRRHRAVQPEHPRHARSAAADLHDDGPRRGGEESRGVSVARSAGNESRSSATGRRRRSSRRNIRTRFSSARRRARI